MTKVVHALEKVIGSGLDYIISKQAKNGSWTEWELPPGSSSTWTTAYIGFKLRNLPQNIASTAIPHILAAARWLNESMYVDCGWGYNEVAGSDADSTSYAILFLRSTGQQVADASYTLLYNLQREDGGFATYLPVGKPNSWNISHTDVTPIALLALLTHAESDRSAIRRGIEYVQRQKTPLGLWNSFWWGSCLYGTEASLSLLNAAGIRMPFPFDLAQVQTQNAFELALMISCLLYVNYDIPHLATSDLVVKLINQQRSDGSWNTEPILRVTRRDCYEPWVSSNPGQLYEDPKRLFTSATVLHALAKVYASLRG